MEKLTTELILDESRRDRRGRRMTAAKRREELLGAYDQSGLTQAEFARREGIKYPTFTSWVQARRNGAASAAAVNKPAGRVRFEEMPMPVLYGRAASDALSVTMSGGLVVRGSDVGLTASLIKTLNA